jgi:hypothetical protein
MTARKITPHLFAFLLVALIGLSDLSFGQDDVPDAPEQIRPLLVGATIPDLTLTTIEGESFHLMTAVRSQPTVLIYYRGGW